MEICFDRMQERETVKSPRQDHETTAGVATGSVGLTSRHWSIDGSKCKVWISGGLDDENQNLWWGVLVKNEEYKDGRK